MSDWGLPGETSDSFGVGRGRTEPIELVGPHLRVSGTIALGRFNRLSDLVNHSRGFVRLHDATLLRRNGDPTSLILPELMVNQDEITFIGQAEHVLAAAPNQDAATIAPTPGDRPTLERAPRRYVVFTPGHAISGLIHVHREMTPANFVEAADPRFVPMTSVTARSLADRRVISHFQFLLVNRTQMTAVAETDPGSAVSDAVADVQGG
ncbi:MAG: hypothetical protein V4515_04360 [Chloroflexota bacterium]